MKKLLLINKAEMVVAPPRTENIDYLETHSVPPAWITEEEIKVLAGKFEESGFTGGFNYYRALNLNWELMAAWQGLKIGVPAKLIVGTKDMGYRSSGTKKYIESSAFKSLVPDHEIVVLDAHHFIHLERADQVSQQILSFINSQTLLT